MSDHAYPCDGCGQTGDTVVLYLDAPLGRCAVWVHRDRACAEAAREARGGGKWRRAWPVKQVIAQPARAAA